MNDISVDSAISELLNLSKDSRLSSSMKDQVNHLLVELRFLGLYTHCLAKWNEALQDNNNRQHFRESKILQINATLEEATKGLYSTGIKALQTTHCQDWEALAAKLLEEIQLCKPNIGEDCLDFLSCSFRYEFFGFELRIFWGCLWDSINDLSKFKADTIPDLKVQIQRMKERLQFFIQISVLNPIMEASRKDVEDFKILIQTWLHDAACQIISYWILEGNKEDIESRNKMFLFTPRITRMFLEVLKCLRLQNRFLMHLGVLTFADFVLEILQICPLEDDIETLRSGLILLTTFLVDPPSRKDAESISQEVESLISSLSGNDVKGAAKDKSSVLVNSFMQKMNGVIPEVRRIYTRDFLDLSSFNFPSTDVLRFFNSLLDDLNGISEHSTNSEIVKVHKELKLLSPFLEKILELPDDNLEMKDLRTRIVNVLYRAKFGMQLLLYRNNFVWYDAEYLSHVMDEIELLKIEKNKIQDQEICNIIIPAIENYTTPDQASSKFDEEIFVGFEDESKAIFNKLVGGSTSLNIVSIFGLPGQGKTTLTRKIYNNPSVQKHFDKRAWCSVSQTYQNKRLFLEILSGIAPDDDFSGKDDEELEQLLQRRLFGRKYLIVMDDIWDVRAWNVLKSSFPDQNNGSRIMFTSRYEDVALKAKQGSILHPLRQISSDESLELLKKKLFGKEDFPPNLMHVSEKIANDCNGLPLAVVVIAGILSENVDNLDWWNHIAESIKSQANDGCEHMVELSYKHLPEILKPCFLYFGAFQEDRVIRVRKLIQLWIAEGFVQRSEGKTLEVVAKEYLMNLVTRSLIMVARRSSNGRIKSCRIHDLLRQFCFEKAKRENFLRVESSSEPCTTSSGAVFKNYRICIQTGENGFLGPNLAGKCVHSLLLLLDDSPFMYDREHFSICNFELLQVLDLEDIEFNGYFPKEVLLLILLRYLAIRYRNGALSIPSAIANLRNLETLRVKRYSRFGNEVSLPNTIWRMKRIRHIDVGTFNASPSNDCEPQESYVLENIQSFSAPLLCFGEAAEKLLRRIAKIRKLRCQFNDSCKECNKFPSLEFLDQLESLNVMYTGKLFQPNALSFPLKLKKLTLSNFRLPWNHMSTIGQLPELEVLKLLDDAFDGKTWDLQDDEFQNLKFLKLCNLNIARWKSGDSPFPSLEQLIVEECDKLEEIPYIFGESIYSLKRVEIHWCNPAVASSAWQIEKDFEHVEVIVLGTKYTTNEVIVGFTYDRDVIVDRLTRRTERLEIIPIVGVAGQGKTTLAKMVYQDPEVQSHFHICAWCSVSPRYQSRDILHDISRDIGCYSSEMTEDKLKSTLGRSLQGWRYLIVLDNMLVTKTFLDLKDLFPNDSNGSRILITSRFHAVAREVSSLIAHELRPLSEVKSWELLQVKLFQNNVCPPTFAEVGKQIARKCNGLPLAIVVIADLLLKKVDNLEWWKQVAESDLDSQIANKGGMDLLETSYQHLPEILKLCFLYLGLFAEGRVIRAQRVIQRWISERFVPETEGKSLEDVAEEYLSDLVSRSLVVVTNRSCTGAIKECRVDNLIFYFCSAKGRDERFLRVESCDDIFFDPTSTIRKDYRLRIQSWGDSGSANPFGLYVHSLLFIDQTCLNKEDLSTVYNFKLLQVLDMEDMEFNGYFPVEVMMLVLLTYLAIWCSNGMVSVPSSIANLKKLETFRVKRQLRYGDEICLPETLWRMKRLRHVDVGRFSASFSGDVENLALDDIQTFSSPCLSHVDDAEKLLRRLPNVRKLRCLLNYSWDLYQEQDHFRVLDVDTKLQSLTLMFVGSVCPPCIAAFYFPSTLEKVTLENCTLTSNEMSTIGKLPNLRFLKLLTVALDGGRWVVEDDEFITLEFLKLCKLNVAEWDLSEDASPCLQQVIVEDCDELEKLPSRLADIQTLWKIQVRGCKPEVLDSALWIQEEQRDCGNEDLEVHIMDIH